MLSKTFLIVVFRNSSIPRTTTSLSRFSKYTGKSDNSKRLLHFAKGSSDANFAYPRLRVKSFKTATTFT